MANQGDVDWVPTDPEFRSIMLEHERWSRGKPGNHKKADFRFADLGFKDFGEVDVRFVDFCDTDLREANLRRVQNLVPDQLAGADLSGAILPSDFTFSSVESIRLAISYARKLYAPIILICLALLWGSYLSEPSKQVQVPFINVLVSMRVLLMYGSVCVSVIFLYFQLYLTDIWNMTSSLPSYFPDGFSLGPYPDPWFIIKYSWVHVFRIKQHQNNWGYFWGLFSGMHAYLFVPLVLFLVMIQLLLQGPTITDESKCPSAMHTMYFVLPSFIFCFATSLYAVIDSVGMLRERIMITKISNEIPQFWLIVLWVTALLTEICCQVFLAQSWVSYLYRLVW